MKTMQQGSTKTNGFETAGAAIHKITAAGRFFCYLCGRQKSLCSQPEDHRQNGSRHWGNRATGVCVEQRMLKCLIRLITAKHKGPNFTRLASYDKQSFICPSVS